MNASSGFSAAQLIISAMITPALLILASGSLIATALVRLARVVDRIRRVLELPPSDDRSRELALQHDRALVAERAIAVFFAAIVCFVLAGFFIAIDRVMDDQLTWLPVGSTVLGMLLLVVGSGAMLWECPLALRQIQYEVSGASTSNKVTHW